MRPDRGVHLKKITRSYSSGLLEILFYRLAFEVYETIADAAFRQDIFGVSRVFFDFFTQIIHIKPDIMRLVAVFIPPHFRQ